MSPFGPSNAPLLARAAPRELDTYPIPEDEDPAFATGFGNLTIHEVIFDPTAPAHVPGRHSP